MRLILIVVALAATLPVLMATGCSHPYTRLEHGPNSEWFIFVPTELSMDDHERFEDELGVFISRYTPPGDVIHILCGDGVMSFTLRVPKPKDEGGANELKDAIEEATSYFLDATHLEAHDSCHLDLEMTEWRMEQLRETDFRHPVILIGSPRPHRLLNYGCECDHAPHSLLKEYFAERLHPEYRVKTKKMLDFEREHYRITR